MSSPFSDIRDWQHAIARWADLVTPTAVEPSTASADSGRVSAVGDITLAVLATDVTVRAVLRMAYRDSGGASHVSYEIGREIIHATDVEEAVALIVARARRAPPPPTGRYQRRRP